MSRALGRQIEIAQDYHILFIGIGILNLAINIVQQQGFSSLVHFGIPKYGMHRDQDKAAEAGLWIIPILTMACKDVYIHGFPPSTQPVGYILSIHAKTRILTTPQQGKLPDK